MALTGVLGTVDSVLGGIVPGHGAIVSGDKTLSAADSAKVSDAASSNVVTTNVWHASAHDLATFTGLVIVSPASQTVVGWISPEQSTTWIGPGGFFVTPSNMLGAAVYGSTVQFDLILTDEYDGADLLLRIFWTGNLASAWSGSIEVFILPVPQSEQIFLHSPYWDSGSVAFSFPVASAWTLQETAVVLGAAAAPFALTPGQVYAIWFRVMPSGNPSGFSSMSVPFMICGIEIQNK